MLRTYELLCQKEQLLVNPVGQDFQARSEPNGGAEIVRSRRLLRNCPASFYGADSVIAFSYPGERTVDLWYATSGCETLDNGYQYAYQAANPSFYATFESAFAAAVRH